MKKIAVLLMLVAFASFITGCSLTGKSRDAAGLEALASSQIPFAVATQIDGTLAAGNIRASAKVYTVAEVKAMTMELGGRVLPYLDHSFENNILEVEFGTNIPVMEIEKIIEVGLVEMVVKAADAAPLKKFEITLPREIISTEKAAPKLTISKSNEVTIVINKDDEKEVAKPVTAIETSKEPLTLNAEIEVKKSSDADTEYVEFKDKMKLAYDKPTFKIAVKDGSKKFNLSNAAIDFSLTVKNEKGTTLDINDKKTAESTSFGSTDFSAHISKPVDGEVIVALAKTLTKGKYTISIPQMIIKQGEDQARLRGLSYEFTIDIE